MKEITDELLQTVARQLPNGNAVFATKLSQIKEPAALLEAMNWWVGFNAPFGAGVAMLSSLVAVQFELFREGGKNNSYLIAQKIMRAAEEEFAGQTHRAMAQRLVEEIATFFKLPMPSEVYPASVSVLKGYGFFQPQDWCQTFIFQGFGLAAEWTAGPEFQIASDYLENNWPDLMTHLKNAGRADAWLVAHKDQGDAVEEIHTKAAIEAGNLAIASLESYGKKLNAYGLYLHGFRDFLKLHAHFMATL